MHDGQLFVKELIFGDMGDSTLLLENPWTYALVVCESFESNLLVVNSSLNFVQSLMHALL